MNEVKDMLIHVKSIDEINKLERVVRKLRSSQTRIFQNLRSNQPRISNVPVETQKVEVDSNCAEMYVSDNAESKNNTEARTGIKEETELKYEDEKPITCTFEPSYSPKGLRKHPCKVQSLEVESTAIQIFTINAEAYEKTDDDKDRSLSVKEKSAAVRDRGLRISEGAEEIEKPVNCRLRRKRRAADFLIQSELHSDKNRDNEDDTRKNLPSSSGGRKTSHNLKNASDEAQVNFKKASNNTDVCPKTLRRKQNTAKFEEESERFQRTLRSSKNKQIPVIDQQNKALKQAYLAEGTNTGECKPSQARRSVSDRNLFEVMGHGIEFKETDQEVVDVEQSQRILRSADKRKSLKAVLETVPNSVDIINPATPNVAMKMKKPRGEQKQECLTVNARSFAGLSRTESVRIVGKGMKTHQLLDDTVKGESISRKRTLRNTSATRDLPHILKMSERESNTDNTAERESIIRKRTLRSFLSAENLPHILKPSERESLTGSKLSTKEGSGVGAPKCNKNSSPNAVSKMSKFRKTLEKGLLIPVVSHAAASSNEGADSHKKSDFMKRNKLVSDTLADKKKNVNMECCHKKAKNQNNSCEMTSSLNEDNQVSPNYKRAKTLQVCRNWKTKKLGFWDRKLEKILIHIRSRDNHCNIGGIIDGLVPV